MAKNLSEFSPGSAPATTDLTYKTIIMAGAQGADRDGCRPDATAGNTFYYTRRIDTACGCPMKSGNLDKGGTDIYLFGGTGEGGGSCCCQQSSPGQSGGASKFSPRWSNNTTHDFNASDAIFSCVAGAHGCFRPDCVGQCGPHTAICHCAPTGTGGTSGICVQNEAGCGAAPECFWGYGSCCNFAAIASGGGWIQMCCRMRGVANCYTTCSEEPLAECDVGYDCYFCKAPNGGNMEVGTCINKCAEGVCGQNFFASTPTWKFSAFRNGAVNFRRSDACEQVICGVYHLTTTCCDFGEGQNWAGYITQGVGIPGGRSCGSPCCCGSPGSSAMQIIRYHE